MTKKTEEKLRADFEETIDERARRYERVKVHDIIPDEFFTGASLECRDMYVAGNFYGCITLCQSIVEGLSKLVAQGHRHGDDFTNRVRKLWKRGWITDELADAFNAVHGKDRNDFHHLNRNVEQDARQLERRALECLNAIYSIESELFAYDLVDGKIVPKHPKYWPAKDGQLSVYLRDFDD